MRKIKQMNTRVRHNKDTQHELDRPKRPHDTPDRKAIHNRGESSHWINVPAKQDHNPEEWSFRKIFRRLFEKCKLIK